MLIQEYDNYKSRLLHPANIRKQIGVSHLRHPLSQATRTSSMILNCKLLSATLILTS